MSKTAAGFIQKHDGDGFILKPDNLTRYKFCCCGDRVANAVHGGCYLVHDFVGTINDAGDIEVRVFRNDEETERARTMADATHSFTSQPIFRIIGDAPERAPVRARETFINDNEVPMSRSARRRHRTENRDALDENFEIVYDEYEGRHKKIVRDGGRVRVSMMDAERSRGGRFAATDTAKIDEARAVTAAAMTREAMKNDPHLLAMQLADSDLSAYRPGYRFADDTETTEEEHNHTHTHRRRKTVFRDPLGRETDSSESNDSRNATEVAYAEMLDHMQNAWRDEAVNTRDPSGGSVSRALQEIPPAGGWFPSEAEGKTCNVNGVAGTVTRKGDRCYCQPGPAIGATRSDAVPQMMTQDQATQITSAAFSEMVADLHAAWQK